MVVLLEVRVDLIIPNLCGLILEVDFLITFRGQIIKKMLSKLTLTAQNCRHKGAGTRLDVDSQMSARSL